MAKFLSGRRGFLRASSIFPVSIAAGSVAADNAEFCESVPQHPSVPDNDPEYELVAETLWEAFVEGTRAAGEEPEIKSGTENAIRNAQGAKLKKKVRFWPLCEKETTECCFSAGVIADAARRAEGDTEIKMKHFELGKESVKSIQNKRAGKAVVGIAC